MPVLRDTHNLHSDVGTLVVAGGAVAEFASIALLGVLFAVPAESALQELLFVAIGLLVLARVRRRHRRRRLGPAPRRRLDSQGRRVTARLDLTTSQITTRFVVMVVLGAASIAAVFGFEVILGTFLAGILFGALIRGSERESLFGTRLDAIGFGFFVPIFFIVSGMRLDIRAALTLSGLLSVLGFLAILADRPGVAGASLPRLDGRPRRPGERADAGDQRVLRRGRRGARRGGRAAALVGGLVDGPGRPDLGGAVPGALAVRARPHARVIG